MPSSDDPSAANSPAAVDAAGEPLDSQSPGGGETAPDQPGWDTTARTWAKKMFGGAQTSAGHVGTAVATVIGGALGTLLIRNAVAVLAVVAAYGLVALVLYGAAPVRRWLRGLARGPEQAPRPPRRRRSWRARGLAILLVAVLAANPLPTPQ